MYRPLLLYPLFLFTCVRDVAAAIVLKEPPLLSQRLLFFTSNIIDISIGIAVVCPHLAQVKCRVSVSFEIEEHVSLEPARPKGGCHPIDAPRVEFRHAGCLRRKRLIECNDSIFSLAAGGCAEKSPPSVGQKKWRWKASRRRGEGEEKENQRPLSWPLPFPSPAWSCPKHQRKRDAECCFLLHPLELRMVFLQGRNMNILHSSRVWTCGVLV